MLHAQQTVLLSLAPSTLSSYWTAWRNFQLFHSTYSLPFPSLDLATLASYVSHCHTSRSMPSSTIRVYLAGINFIIKLLTGAPHPFHSHPHVSLLLKGIKRYEPRHPPSRQPLTAAILADCIAVLRAG